MNELREPLTIFIIVTSVAAVCSLTAVLGIFILFRVMLDAKMETSRQFIDMAARLAKMPTLEELRGINTQLTTNLLPEMSAAVKAALPADVDRALIMETLERIGVEIPPPPPVIPDAELQQRVRDLLMQGIALAEETARQNHKAKKPYDGPDKRRVCLNYVRSKLEEQRVEYGESRLALDLETTLAVMRLPKNARDGYR